MKFYSTNNKTNKVSFKEALMQGLPLDNGLYMPVSIPDQSKLVKGISTLNIKDISYVIAKSFLDEEFKNSDIEEIIDYSITFDSPLVNIYGNIHILELFHGPTLAFKDFGARFMARTMEKVVSNNNKELNILVATSGDTGSAVANGFYNVEGINVIILYPSKKVSKIQEKQLTTLGKNIHALEVDGSFDQCQSLVKKAFLDLQLTKKINLSSANSINIGRLIPQSFYYFNAFSKLKDKNDVIISVPSGNFGNITAGLLSKMMGLPIKKFIASTNANKAVPDFIKNGFYKPCQTIQTISNAMDVGNPSNIKRIINLYDKIDLLKEDMLSWSFSDNDTINTIKMILKKYKYLLEPHGAVGLLGLENYTKNLSKHSGIFLGTAHPSKFLDVIEPEINQKVEMPERLKNILDKEKQSIKMKNNYTEFSNYLLENFI
ncbi:MAG: threonine synthase [Candidatus Marinimicrobia bacterium]|nr:threonine synthase [Candidatus Neomarinimicrobiota bacterium]